MATPPIFIMSILYIFCFLKKKNDEKRTKTTTYEKIGIMRKRRSEVMNISPSADTARARQRRRDIAIYRACHGSRRHSTIERVAQEHAISAATVYRAISRIEHGNAAHEQKSWGVSRAWTEEALLYMRGYYLKVLRECGTANKAAAYDAVCREAKLRGWHVGSRSSAYVYFKQLPPLLEDYASGGAAAVDTALYQPRDYSKLKPLDCIIGDQHRFDYFVVDERGRPFRPECFVWMDAATRSIYGIHCDSVYNKQTVAAALRMGILRYGLFSTMYTDNGSSELSQHIQDIRGDLSAYGCESEIRHVRARVRNAKAKPIERAFRTLETYLDRQCLPGKVREIGASSAVEWQHSLRLKRQERGKQLLSIEEFTIALIRALDYYMNRSHSALGMSPLEKLDEFVRSGWQPVRMSEQELDYILLAREIRKVYAGGRVRIAGNVYEAATEEGISPLACVAKGTRVVVRYDASDPDVAYAEVPPQQRICRLRRVAKLDFLARGEEVASAMARKRAQIQAVAHEYRRLTEPLPQLVGARRVQEAEHACKAPRLSGSSAVAAQENPRIEVHVTDDTYSLPRMENMSDTQHDRYAAHLRGIQVDAAFAQNYEQQLTHAERVYWEEYIRLQTHGGSHE